VHNSIPGKHERIFAVKGVLSQQLGGSHTRTVAGNKELIDDCFAGRHSRFERIEVAELITLGLIHVMEVVVDEDFVSHLSPARL